MRLLLRLLVQKTVGVTDENLVLRVWVDIRSRLAVPFESRDEQSVYTPDFLAGRMTLRSSGGRRVKIAIRSVPL